MDEFLIVCYVIHAWSKTVKQLLEPRGGGVSPVEPVRSNTVKTQGKARMRNCLYRGFSVTLLFLPCRCLEEPSIDESTGVGRYLNSTRVFTQNY